MQTIYQQLEPDTRVIERFHRDFTFHDLESFNAAEDGDAAIWSAGKCGTHIAFTHRAGHPVKSDHVAAVAAVYGSNPVWRRIAFTGPNTGKVSKMTGPPAIRWLRDGTVECVNT